MQISTKKMFNITQRALVIYFLVPACKVLAQQNSNTLVNPLVADDIVDFLNQVVDILLVFALPIIILCIMYAGFLFVTAQGNPSKIETARSALLWALLGGLLILGAKAILTVIQGTVNSLRS